MRVEVYDPAMCCSTGVCGPKVDPALAQFASDLDWLAGQGVEVIRFNLSQEPGAFVTNPAVSQLLQQAGDSALPAVLVDGAVRSSGRFPKRHELAGWTGVEARAEAATRIPVPVAAGDCCGGSGSQAGCC